VVVASVVEVASLSFAAAGELSFAGWMMTVLVLVAVRPWLSVTT
jgi:hypothetical protein